MKKSLFVLAISALTLLAANAQLKFKENKFDESKVNIRALEEVPADSKAPTLAIELNNRGVGKAIKENNYAEAALLFHQAANLCAECFTIQLNLGLSLNKTGDFDKSLEVFEKLTVNYPNSSDAHAGLGEAFHAKKLYSESVKAYRRAIELDPKDAILLSNYGNALFHVKDYKNALYYFDEALKIEPNFVTALSNRGAVLFMLGEHKKSLESIKKAAAIAPNLPEVQNNLGVALDRAGKRKEAHKCYLEAVRLKPDYASALYNLAVSYFQFGDKQAARTQVDALEKINAEMAQTLRKAFVQQYIIDASALTDNK